MTTYDDSRKSLPRPTDKNFDAQVRQALEAYMGNQGNPLDRGVTVGDLAAAGLITLDPRYLAGQTRRPIGSINTVITSPGAGGDVIIPGVTYEPDLTPPPTPTGFIATPAIGSIIVECDNQTYTEGHGHAVSVLYGAKRTSPALPVFSSAVLLTEFSGSVGSYATDPSTTWHLWLKWKTKDGVESDSPAGGTNGVVAVTGADVRNLLDALTEAANTPAFPYSRISWRAAMFDITAEGGVAGTPLFAVVTTPITVGGVTVPIGTYMQDAFIMNGTITNAKIANLAVDDAKISSLAVGKLTAGSMQVGAFIRSTNYVAGVSGFSINGIGTAELNEIIVRGSGFFGGGSIGGIIIEPTRIRSSNYTGGGVGFAINTNGTIDLPSGTVNAIHLNVGAGANLLANSTFVDQSGGNISVPTGWEYGANESFQRVYRMTTSLGGWFPPGMEGVGMQSGAATSGGHMLIQANFACVPGQRYEASVYSGAHRCLIYTDFVFYDANGNIVGNMADNALSNNQELAGGTRLDLFKRIGHFGVAPPTASRGNFRIIKQTTLTGADSYAMIVAPFVGLARTSQTAFSAYSPSGLGVRVTPSGITTPSIAAITAVLGDCYAGSLRGGSYSGYAWPGNGDGGFYLGPEGLLLGNANAGRYVQITRDGNLYMPGLNIENGVMNFWKANIISTANIVQGSVTFALAASGNNRADIIFGIPGGEVWNIALFASYGASNAVAYGAVGDISNAARTLSLTASPISDRQLVYLWDGGGPPIGWLFNAGSALFSQLVLGPGTHQLTALVNYEVYAFNSPVSIMAFIFKR
jgi:hypothetical protein